MKHNGPVLTDVRRRGDIETEVDVRSADFEALKNRIVNAPQTMINVTLGDGAKVEMLSRKLFLHLHYWEVAMRWDIPVDKELVYPFNTVGNSDLCKFGTRLLRHIGRIDPRKCRSLSRDVYAVVNFLAQWSMVGCERYASTISAWNYGDMYNIPGFSDIIGTPIRTEDGSVSENQREFDRRCSAVWDLIKKPHPNNALEPYVALGLIDPTQTYHTFGQIGYKTDLNNYVFAKIIEGNYVDGLKDLIEYVAESLQAKRSKFGNKKNIPEGSYTGRIQHLAASSLQYLEWGDCGTTETVRFAVESHHRDIILWAYVVDRGKTILITPENVDDYVGRVIQLRSPMKCKVRDGVCEKCAGMLLSTVLEPYNVGIYASTMVSEPITQTMLKEKHVATNRIEEYRLPLIAQNVFVLQNNMLFIKPDKRKILKDYKLAVSVSESNTKVINLIHGSVNGEKYSSSVFGQISKVDFASDKYEPYLGVTIAEDPEQEIYFSKEFVEYVQREATSKGRDEEFVWIDLAGVDPSIPFFKVTATAYSMPSFVSDCKKYLENTIKTVTDPDQALEEFMDIVSAQVKINIGYIGMILRALMVTDMWDYRIPDGVAETVTFQGQKTINKKRGYGTLVAFQGLQSEVSDRLITVVPRKYNPFDSFVNMKDVRIKRGTSWISDT